MFNIFLRILCQTGHRWTYVKYSAAKMRFAWRVIKARMQTYACTLYVLITNCSSTAAMVTPTRPKCHIKCTLALSSDSPSCHLLLPHQVTLASAWVIRTRSTCYMHLAAVYNEGTLFSSRHTVFPLSYQDSRINVEISSSYVWCDTNEYKRIWEIKLSCSYEHKLLQSVGSTNKNKQHE